MLIVYWITESLYAPLMIVNLCNNECVKEEAKVKWFQTIKDSHSALVYSAPPETFKS